jgi:hypothetical protein
MDRKNNLDFCIICLLIILVIIAMLYVTNEGFENNDIVNPDENIVTEQYDIPTFSQIPSEYKYVEYNINNPTKKNESNLISDDPKTNTKSIITQINRIPDKDVVVNTSSAEFIKNPLDCVGNYENREGYCYEICPENYIVSGNKCIKRTSTPSIISKPIPIEKCNKFENEIDNECYSCPDGYNLDKDNENCVRTLIREKQLGVINCKENEFQYGLRKCVNLDIKNITKNPKKLINKCPEGQDTDPSGNCHLCLNNQKLDSNYNCIEETSIDRKIKELNCPTGYILDSPNNLCVKYECLSGTLDPTTNKCISYECPIGYTYDSQFKSCLNDEKCPKGYIYENGFCRKYSCPEGFNFNENTKTCVSSVPEGLCINGVLNPTTNKCEACKGTLINGKCYHKECNESNIDADGNCYICGENSGLYKINDEYKCIACQKDYTYDLSNNMCVSNKKYCNDKQTNDDNCNICPVDYIYDSDKNKCYYKNCGPNNILNDVCYKCDGFVEADNDGNIKCKSCPSGYLISKDTNTNKIKCIKI